MVAIIISAIASALCIAAIIIDVILKHYGWAAIMSILAGMNLGFLAYDIGKYQEKKHQGGEGPKVEQVEVSNVLRYRADTITIIHGADTTKTYNLTYWIEQ